MIALQAKWLLYQVIMWATSSRTTAAQSMTQTKTTLTKRITITKYQSDRWTAQDNSLTWPRIRRCARLVARAVTWESSLLTRQVSRTLLGNRLLTSTSCMSSRASREILQVRLAISSRCHQVICASVSSKWQRCSRSLFTPLTLTIVAILMRVRFSLQSKQASALSKSSANTETYRSAQSRIGKISIKWQHPSPPWNVQTLKFT